jgi:16S rRNA (cytosine1402-N4)-methyltransferase
MSNLPGKSQEASHHLHKPVLMTEVLEGLAPALSTSTEQNPLRYFDGTFGRGGHLRAVLEKFSGVRAVAVDQDPEAIAYAKENFASEISAGRLEIHHCNFTEFSVEKFGLFDAMLLDLGVSSPQLDQGLRGFSFYHDGPLDMRMNNAVTGTTDGSGSSPTAADIINTWSEDELNELFQQLGEVPRPYRVTRAIVHDRREKPYATTRDLAGLIERVEGWHRKGHHPATQYFLALRLLVNRELDVVENSLLPLVHGLKSKARLAVLTFHSLEDRIVKNKFKEFADEAQGLGSLVNKKVIQAEWNEAKENSRARSAKLRIFERK